MLPLIQLATFLKRGKGDLSSKTLFNYVKYFLYKKTLAFSNYKKKGEGGFKGPYKKQEHSLYHYLPSASLCYPYQL